MQEKRALFILNVYVWSIISYELTPLILYKRQNVWVGNTCKLVRTFYGIPLNVRN